MKTIHTLLGIGILIISFLLGSMYKEYKIKESIHPNIIELPEEIALAKPHDSLYVYIEKGFIKIGFYHHPQSFKEQWHNKNNDIYIIR